MNLGAKLKLLRTQKGVTQEAFAEELQVSRSAIAKWESNNGFPEISNLKQISQVLNVSLDELLDDNKDIADSTQKVQSPQSEYIGHYCDIDLIGWNDGVSHVLVVGEDKDFLFYKKAEKPQGIFGMLGKKYIKSVDVLYLSDALDGYDNINRTYFCNKHVCIEVAHKEGFLSGFLDFRNDDYLDVIINAIKDSNVLLKFGREIEIDSITKIELLEF
uniref:helix-turn-helix domain-containing protein n=1 Tax=Agathobacter sp. TaxID=2021311 RepID=UPI0040570837